MAQDRRQAEMEAWLKAQPAGAIDPQKFADAMVKISAKYGVDTDAAGRKFYHDYAVANYSKPGPSVWEGDYVSPLSRRAAPSGAQQQAIPLAKGYQAALDVWHQNHPRGSVDPQDYADFRQQLDKQYGYAVNPEQRRTYTDFANKYNNSRVGVNLRVPDPTAPLTGTAYARNQAVADPIGAAVTSFANARGLGIPGALEPEKMAALAEAHPYASTGGDMAGMVSGINLLSSLGRQASLRVAPRLLGDSAAKNALRVGAADAAYGAARGAAEQGDPLGGAVDYGVPALAMHGLGALAVRGVRGAPKPAYEISEQGPFLNVARSDVEPQIVPEMRTAPNISAMRAIMAKPENNPALRLANELSVKQRGVPLDTQLPVSSLQRQSGIARAFEAAVEGSPEYKHAAFEAYGNQMPELVEKSGAQNYDQLTEAAYRALADDMREQFHRLPVRMRYHEGAGEYATPSAMFRDVLGEGNLNVYRGGDPHDFLNRVDPETGLNENEMFRANHDFVGHVATGSTFRPGGEDIAYAAHANTVSPLAQLALLSETRGQNSLVNYGTPNADLLLQVKPLQRQMEERGLIERALARGDRDAPAYRQMLDQLPSRDEMAERLRELGAQTQYAPQKAVLLPPEYLDTLSVGGVPDWLRPIIKPRAASEVTGLHFGQPGLTETDPNMWGRAASRQAEYPSLSKAGGVGRTYFYTPYEGQSLRDISPEDVVLKRSGTTPYHAELGGLYDVNADPEKLMTLAKAYNLPDYKSAIPYNYAKAMGAEHIVDGRSAIPDLERMAREYGYSGLLSDFGSRRAAAVFDPVKLTPGYSEGGMVQ